MANYRLLIVEDDPSEISTWKMQIPRYAANHNTEFEADFADSISNAEYLIKSRRYDAAIVDIRLKGIDGTRDAGADGNRVRELLTNSEVLIVAHITGEPGAIENNSFATSGIIKVFEKGQVTDTKPLHEEILDWISSHKVMIDAIRKSKKIIKEKMASLFFSSIWPRWRIWSSVTGSDDFIEASLARHISSHLYAELLGNTSGKVHPEEWYFMPPNSARFRAGDICKKGDSYLVLISPRCDLERPNVGDTLIFANLQDISTIWVEELSKTTSRIDECKRIIRELENDAARVQAENQKILRAEASFRKRFYGHSDGNFRLHFIPPIALAENNIVGPFYIDFSDIHQVKYGHPDADSLLASRVAQISPEFLPALVQRLGAYISRIGSPDYSHIY
ncbi:MAG: hypothetical protein Q7W55_15840 [Pseudohongiella sp.]|nr:hypothetical protein [Pseudohongiella sp.]